MSTTITSLTGLQKLPNLVGLNADWVSLQSVNLSGLSKLTNADLSDSIRLDNEGHSLTNVVLTGCTSLESLRLDGSDFSAGIPNLQGLNALTWLDLDSCGITGEVDLTMLPNLRGVDLSSNQVTSLIIPESPIDSINLYNNALTDTAVNSLLQWLNGSGIQSGYLDLSGGTSAAPTGNGITAKADLESKSWYVVVNSANAGNLSLTVTNTGQFDISAGSDFTIEWSSQYRGLNNHPRAFSFGSYNSGGASHAVSIENGIFYWWVNGQIIISQSVSVEYSWRHICIQRSNNVVKVFINGAVVASANFAGAIPTSGKPLYIGSEGDDSLSNAWFSNFRWNSTTAVYNHEGFTKPSSPLTSVYGTKLLLFQGDSLQQQLTDNSGMGNVITNGGGTYNINHAYDPFGCIQFGTMPTYFAGVGTYNTNVSVACSDFSSNQIQWLYYPIEIVKVGNPIFLDTALTTPIPDGYFVINGTRYTTLNGSITSLLGSC